MNYKNQINFIEDTSTYVYTNNNSKLIDLSYLSFSKYYI